MFKLLNFNVIGNNNGKLIALEKGGAVPFDIKRVYYIWGTKEDAVRGKHSHRGLEQIIICLAGSCDFILDNGKRKESIHLNDPRQGLYIKDNVWREFTNFSKDCVLMVLVSEKYNEDNYIRDYEIFLKEVNA